MAWYFVSIFVLIQKHYIDFPNNSTSLFVPFFSEYNIRNNTCLS